MTVARKHASEKSREWRRSVVIPARLKSGAQWSDACILNISSRGLMIHSGRAGPSGSFVERHRAGLVIVARVVWRNGAKAGLQSDEKLPVEQIMAATAQASLRLVASEGAIIERRDKIRSKSEHARALGRRLEYIVGCAVALALAMLVARSAFEMLKRPFTEVDRALLIDQ